ncbi:FxsA family protein [Halomonas sp. MCCC 1A17488]|uniref:FxsA family protein n=1 Tax=Billgrantia sulfidoxydans TaxID=2733484 RepID=A0ABX7W3V6_9GAMM|nr:MULTISPECIES: FxsA family protein [Halomonas]MCE8015428.1 FxsA family protein [Halomonas sp. MCCC 1A17488]MCG3238761.1 FxsA family protein [Halomonas sp. MCCC 1A17488]QPP51273.1 FxsA family protein [Halomonas sp. SS10-MC5]QTP54830.1 FxsA family protein [Halomonas sulfidoxydans]
MPLLILFTLFTLLDFIVLFSVGSQIGLLPTLALVLATGFIGLHLIRRQGIATLARARQRLAQGELPSGELFTGAALIFGGALMLAPGFLSDALGLLCVLPGARRLLARLLALINLRLLAGVHRHSPGGTGHGGEWHRPEHGPNARSDDETRQSAGQGQPLEGDFISRNEPRR